MERKIYITSLERACGPLLQMGWIEKNGFGRTVKSPICTVKTEEELDFHLRELFSSHGDLEVVDERRSEYKA